MKKLLSLFLSLAAALTTLTGCAAITERSDDILPPQLNIFSEDIVLDSLDKVNYYGGLKVLSDGKSSQLNSTVVTLPMTFYTDYDPSVDSELWYPDTDDSIPPVINGEDVSMCTFKITTAIYFKIKIENDDFLSDKIGTGEAEVVITDLTIDLNPWSMITFRNQDRFYSCLSETDKLNNGENNFFTHLYIKGFELYKDTTNGVSHFKVDIDTDTAQINSISWIPYNRIPAEAPVYPIQTVENSFSISYHTYEFTLWELKNDYNNENETECNEETLPKDTTYSEDTTYSYGVENVEQ